MSGKIQIYRDLVVWQRSKDLALAVYEAVKKFPSDERYALVSQAKRAAVSVPANIAEGFGRTSQKDREHFYTMARGSVYELDTHIQIARELGFISKEEHAILLGLIGDVTKLLGAFIRTHKSRNPNL